VCSPLVTVITSIGLDHTHILGDTISKIAWEKAGILKAGVPVVQGQLPGDADCVVEARARDLACPRYVCGREFAWHDAEHCDVLLTPMRSQKILVLTPRCSYENVSVPLLGRHQAHNASLAIMTADLLRDHDYTQITAEAITQGIKSTHWPLRFEILDGHPSIVLDAAHNPDSMRAVAGVLDGPEWQGRRRVLVFAASADKDAASMLNIIVPHFNDVVLTRFVGNPRSVPPEQLQLYVDGLNAELLQMTQFYQANDPPAAIAKARELAGPDGLICVTGSLFLAAEARVYLLKSSS
jgi:dihydrofolate synthase/folylpolyglutamate synthase